MPSRSCLDRPVLAELADIFRSVLHDPDLELTPRSTVDDIPGWDSMTHISLVVEAECRFGIEFHPTEIDSLSSVGALARAIESKRAVAA